MTETVLTATAPPLRGEAARHAARRRPPAATAFKRIGDWILAALHAHARRQVILALGERVDAFNQAIRAGADARRTAGTSKE